MHKNVLLCSLTLLTIGVQGALAQAPAAAPAAPAPAVSFTATASVVSQYMFRGQRLNGAGFQPSIEAAAGDLTLGVWSNLPFHDKVPDSSDPEIDVYGSYTVKLNDAASLQPGFTAYYYASAPTNAGFYRTTFEPNIAFNYTIQGVKLTPKFYYDVVLKAATYELTGAYAVPVKEIGSELDFVATAGTYKGTDVANNTNPSVKAWGDYWLVGVSAPFQVTKNGKVIVGYAYTEGRNAYGKQGRFPKSVNPLAVGRGVVTISYAWAF